MTDTKGYKTARLLAIGYEFDIILCVMSLDLADPSQYRLTSASHLVKTRQLGQFLREFHSHFAPSRQRAPEQFGPGHGAQIAAILVSDLS